jgi:histone H3/H4
MHQCPRCEAYFSTKERLLGHVKYQIDCATKMKNFSCDICLKKFTRKSCRDEHRKAHTRIIKPIPVPPIKHKVKLKNNQNVPEEQIESLKKQVEELIAEQKKLAELIAEHQQPITNNITNKLKLVCVSQNDNYFDMLTERKKGEVKEAIKSLKAYALTGLAGDQNLLNLIYLTDTNSSIHYINKTLTRIQYCNEHGQLIIASKKDFGKILAKNLKNSYLKGDIWLNDHPEVSNELLDPYDIEMWRQHVSQLSDDNVKYHKDIVKGLKIKYIDEH